MKTTTTTCTTRLMTMTELLDKLQCAPAMEHYGQYEVMTPCGPVHQDDWLEVIRLARRELG